VAGRLPVATRRDRSPGDGYVRSLIFLAPGRGSYRTGARFGRRTPPRGEAGTAGRRGVEASQGPRGPGARGRHPYDPIGRGDRTVLGERAARRRVCQGPDHLHLRASGAAALRGDEHVYGLPVRRGRAGGRELRRGDSWGAVGHRNYVPSGSSLRTAGHQARLGALRHLQLRDGHRHKGAAPGCGHRRRLPHPGQHREELRPDRTRGQPRGRERGFSR
jgi:hypothetical protein